MQTVPQSHGPGPHRRAAVWTLCALFLPTAAHAVDSWGGSLDVTSDYLVRGLSRSNHDAALQADMHVASDSGLIGGVFASSVKVVSGAPLSAELSAFLGYAWQAGSAWRLKALASYYAYAGGGSGSQYNYAEIAFETAYDDWLDLELVYSPDQPRYVEHEYLSGVAAKSADLTARTPWLHGIAGIAGAGYSHFGGPGGGGYFYWSAGAAADLAPWTVSVAYVSTSAEAATLFYDAAAHDRWTASIMRRF
jgi:uncharacterized protein (TIGR02001 family)